MLAVCWSSGNLLGSVERALNQMFYMCMSISLSLILLANSTNIAFWKRFCIMYSFLKQGNRSKKLIIASYHNFYYSDLYNKQLRCIITAVIVY